MESLFVLWRVTGKPHFREWSWNIFRAFQQHSRVEEGGYANLDSCLLVATPLHQYHNNSELPSDLLTGTAVLGSDLFIWVNTPYQPTTVLTFFTTCQHG
jgi:hypothetical protein